MEAGMENERMTERYFVWISGLRGPEAQIWDEEKKQRDGKKIVTLLTPIKLHAKDDRPLDQLAKDYPCV